MDQLAPQRMPFAEFAKAANAVKLENHGREWEVHLNGRSLGFADGPTSQDALRAAHKREVNNALYANSEDAPDHLKAELPTAIVLAEYPELEQLFPNAAAQVIRHRKPYVPQWKAKAHLGEVANVAEAMDRYYRPERLSRPDGTRERLIADREQTVAKQGYDIIASHHDSITGRSIYIRSKNGALIVYSDH